MSLLSRVLAPPASHDLAGVIGGLLSSMPTAPTDLPGVDPPPRGGWSPGPTGLGTASLRLSPDRPDRETDVPELYCPTAVRDDPALGEVVNERLVAWAAEVGIYPGQLNKVREANFGRLMMLTHPDCDDPERLLAAGKCALAEWSVDDHYVDGEAAEAVPELLGQQLAIAYTAIEPAYLPVRYTPEHEAELRSDPVMVALRSAIGNLGQYASHTQVARLQHELAMMFIAYSQEAVWRTTKQLPPVWEYLVHRHENSFIPCMALIDAMGGYEVPPHEFWSPRVRRAFRMAGTASVLLNDLYSMGKEDPTDTNLPTVIAAEENCSLPEAIERSAAVHDELMHTFEAEAAALYLAGSPALQRFLAGVWNWMGGSRTWHSTSARYHS